MTFIKKLFNNDKVIGLSGLRKRREFVQVTIPEGIKTTELSFYNRNYILI